MTAKKIQPTNPTVAPSEAKNADDTNATPKTAATGIEHRTTFRSRLAFSSLENSMKHTRRSLACLAATSVAALALTGVGAGPAAMASQAAPHPRTVLSIVKVWGGVNLDHYCKSIGYRGVALVAHNAYGWKCTNRRRRIPINMYSACAWQYPGAPRVSPAYRDFQNPYSWYCYSTPGQSSGTLFLEPGQAQDSSPAPINVGAKVSIKATGSILYGYEGATGCVGYPAVDPNGNRSLNGVPCNPKVKVDPLTPLPTAPVGALIARVGSTGPWHLIGSSGSITATQTGTLFVAYNDEIRSDDHGGGYVIKYTVT